MNAREEWETFKLMACTWAAVMFLVVALVTLMLTWPAFFQYWNPVCLPATILVIGGGLASDFWRAKRYGRKQARKRLTSVN